jgi:NAD(P)-dependent dehydrogenase (short-subunit alcohol dehydrogenase family)
MHSTPIDVGSLFSLKGKTALVTGGSRGIGLMIARGYVEAGANVYISSRKKDVCDAVAAELNAIGPCISLPADLATGAECTRLAGELRARETKLDILVNNAGAAWGATLGEFPESGFDKVLDINVKAVFLLTQACLPMLEAAGTQADPARVINIGSIDGIQVPEVDSFSYSASKAAVHHMTEVLAVKLAGKHVTVNAIAPGPFESKMTEWMLSNFRQSYEQRCPVGRIGVPADMAGAALYLASRAGAYVNGAIIPVDGGLRLV